MQNLQVTWITPDADNPETKIKIIGGEGFAHSLIEAAYNMLYRTHRYWLLVDGEPVWLTVAARPGPLYLRSETDSVEPESLLALPVRTPASA